MLGLGICVAIVFISNLVASAIVDVVNDDEDDKQV